MKAKHQRLVFILVSLAVFAVAVALVLQALNSRIVFFYSPAEIAALPEASRNVSMRVGGLVQPGSTIDEQGLHSFTLTDHRADLRVHFSGPLPALFREGQGIVAEGKLAASGEFEARTVLAKHDENYMPPEVAKALKRQGHWKTNYGTANEQE